MAFLVFDDIGLKTLSDASSAVSDASRNTPTYSPSLVPESSPASSIGRPIRRPEIELNRKLDQNDHCVVYFYYPYFLELKLPPQDFDTDIKKSIGICNYGMLMIGVPDVFASTLDRKLRSGAGFMLRKFFGVSAAACLLAGCANTGPTANNLPSPSIPQPQNQPVIITPMTSVGNSLNGASTDFYDGSYTRLRISDYFYQISPSSGTSNSTSGNADCTDEQQDGACIYEYHPKSWFARIFFTYNSSINLRQK